MPLPGDAASRQVRLLFRRLYRYSGMSFGQKSSVIILRLSRSCMGNCAGRQSAPTEGNDPLCPSRGSVTTRRVIFTGGSFDFRSDLHYRQEVSLNYCLQEQQVQECLNAACSQGKAETICLALCLCGSASGSIQNALKLASKCGYEQQNILRRCAPNALCTLISTARDPLG